MKKSLKSHDTTTANGAVSHLTTGSKILDYFSKSGNYVFRDQSDVDADLSAMWTEDSFLTLKSIFYNRMVSRKTKGFFESDSVQMGQGQRDEFYKSLKWLGKNYPDILKQNIWLIPVVGSWKDLWQLDSEGEFFISPSLVYPLIERGIQDSYNRGLLAKYLPRIRSKSNSKNNRHKKLNAWAFGLCKFLNFTPVEYRKFKSDPQNVAHLFQRQMSSNQWENIDFNAIPGKALFNLISLHGKDRLTAIERHNLDVKYLDWIKTQPTAKFTGYVYELAKAVQRSMNPMQKYTYDSQFNGLLELARIQNEGGLNENVWCAIDTSGSMSTIIDTKGTRAVDVAVSLGIYFSALNEGAFKDYVVMFDQNSKFIKLEGSFTERVGQIYSQPIAWGGTNFQSIIDEIVRIRKSKPNIPIEDYPTTLLVVSDMQFNCTGSQKTNYEVAMDKLQKVGLSKIRIIWWNVCARSKDVPVQMDTQGTVLMSGFDPTSISLILGSKKETEGKTTDFNPYENMLKVLNQQILNQIKYG